MSKEIAFQVAKMAQKQELALAVSDERLRGRIEKIFWQAEYRTYKRVSL